LGLASRCPSGLNATAPGDRPIKDRPLPKFLDDPSAAKLLTAARALPERFDRVAVEVLARTGMRKGELLGLTIEAVVQIGSAFWLRTPVGKMHTDRYVYCTPTLRPCSMSGSPTERTGK
jgi:integrase